jgi:hypothetical protein
MNQTCFITLNPLTLGVKKIDEVKCVIKWRLMRNHHFIHLDDIFNVIINCYSMMLHRIMINIKLPNFFTSLVSTYKKKRQKFDNVQKNLNTKNKKWKTNKIHSLKNGLNSSSCKQKSILLTILTLGLHR